MSAELAQKPLLRGALHQAAAWFALGAGAVLVAAAQTRRGALAAAIYSLSLVTLFTVSAVYHRVHWQTAAARARMRRADHASIFILIAGTYTPVTLLALSAAAGRTLLITIWCAAAAGVILSLAWPSAPKALNAIATVAVGWLIVPYFPQVRDALGPFIWLIVAGGVAYTAGAVIYALKRPDPWPRVFGYHEIFHALTLAGALLHFVVIAKMVL